MKRTIGAIASAVILSALPGLAIAQQQIVKPPVANYWVSGDTAAGMTMPGMVGMGGLMAGMMGGMLMDFVPPAEVARLVREKVVLPASVTECTVPAEVVKRSGGSPFFNFIAYGPEANFAQPPQKPAADPLKEGVNILRGIFGR